jgi:SRSO17 transposase
MKVPRKNMERMEEYVAEYSYQAQQQFLSDSPWDPEPVVAQVARDVDRILGGPDSGLLIDETAFAKKGSKSVGVARRGTFISRGSGSTVAMARRPGYSAQSTTEV